MPIVDKGTISSRQSNDLANRVGRNIYIYIKCRISISSYRYVMPISIIKYRKNIEDNKWGRNKTKEWEKIRKKEEIR